MGLTKKLGASQVILMVKNLPDNAGDKGLILGLILGSGRSPGRGHGNPSVFLPGESHGQRSLVSCRLWGHTDVAKSRT